MAIKIIEGKYCGYQDDYIREYVADTDADLETLPKCCTGSTAVSLESGKVVVVNTQGNWVAFGG